MSTQPEALRLAAALEKYDICSSVEAMPDLDEVAAELRRLYAEVDRLSYRLAYPNNFVCEECNELLAALQEVLPTLEDQRIGGNARAAIEKATKQGGV